MPFELINSIRSPSIIRIEGTTNGNIQIVRNSVPIASLHGTGEMRLDEYGYSIANNSTSPIVITVNTGGTVVLEVSKETTYTTALTGF